MKKLFCLVFLIGLAAALPFSAKAEEKVTNFSSVINVNADGTLTVKENISVTAEHRDINHGIYRYLISDYQGPDKDHYYEASYKVLSVKRNGQIEPYHLSSMGPNYIIYIGDSDKLVPTGEQNYELTYQASGLMRYLGESDELYWNVTGNDWQFPIENVQAQVILPWQKNTYPVFYSYADLYTGLSGSKDHYGRFDVEGDSIVFRSNREFFSGEGMTIVVGFPSGRIAKLLPELREVSPVIKFLNSLNAQTKAGIIAGLSLAVLLFFILIWWFKLKGPEKGTIIAQYEAPQGLSPADVAHVANLGGGLNKALGAAIISLAVKGKLKISKKNVLFTEQWELDQLDTTTDNLSEDEKLLFDNLFKKKKKLKIPNSSSELSSFIYWTYRPYLKKKWNKVVYVKNTGWIVLGTALTMMLLIISLAIDPLSLLSGIIAGFFPIFILLILFLFIVAGIKGSKSNSCFILPVIFFVIIFVIFIIPTVFYLILSWQNSSSFNFGGLFKGTISYWHLVPLLAVVVANIAAFKFISQPTVEGRKLLDEIEGFKLFLVTTEKDRMDFFHPIEQVPEVFEKYFPYAIALGVADKWAARFDNLFKETNGQVAYAPAWYSGSLAGLGGISGISSIGSSLGSSLGSSGGGGGGGAGGGGGGGGGGGW